MNNFDDDHVAQPPAPAAAATVHAEPQVGGGYTRDLDTGKLVNNDPAAAQPDQE